MRKITDWPYNGIGGMKYNFNHKIYDWTETTEEVYEEQLNCLPPIKFVSDCFMVGEAYSGNCYAAFIKVDNRFFGKICDIRTFDKWAYNLEITDNPIYWD